MSLLSIIEAMQEIGRSDADILSVVIAMEKKRLTKDAERKRGRNPSVGSKDSIASTASKDSADSMESAEDADVFSEPSRTCSITNLPSEDISYITPLPPKAEKRSVRNRGTRISLDFRPSEDCLSFAYSLGFSADLEQRTCAEFVDYWIGVPGARGCKLDWPATYRNRLREVAGRMKLRPGGAAVLPFGGHAPPVRNAPASDEEILAFTLEFNKRQQAS